MSERPSGVSACMFMVSFPAKASDRASLVKKGKFTAAGGGGAWTRGGRRQLRIRILPTRPKMPSRRLVRLECHASV